MGDSIYKPLVHVKPYALSAFTRSVPRLYTLIVMASVE